MVLLLVVMNLWAKIQIRQKQSPYHIKADFIIKYNIFNQKFMPKSSFMAVNRQFGAFLSAELKHHCITVEAFRKHCHFDRTAFSNMKRV